MLCLGLPQMAQAHTFITISGDLMADGEDLTITINVNRADLITIFSITGPMTHAQLKGLGGRLRGYFEQGLPVLIDGRPITGHYAGYLPDLLAAGGKIDETEELPEALAFVLAWKIPHGASQLDISCHLFVEENMPMVCQMGLDLPDGVKRQIAYIDGQKHAVFQLRPGVKTHPEQNSPKPSTTHQASPVTNADGAPSTATTSTTLSGWQRAWSAVRLLFTAATDKGLSLVCLVVLLPARHQVPRTLLFLAIFVVSLGAGLCCAHLPHPALWHALAAGSLCLLAINQASARPITSAYWWPLVLCAVLQGINDAVVVQQSGPGTSGTAGLTLPVLGLALGGVAVQVAVMGVAMLGVAPWRGRTWYEQALGRPLVLLIAVAAGLVGVLRAVTLSSW